MPNTPLSPTIAELLADPTPEPPRVCFDGLNPADARPVLLLAIDGVINDLRILAGLQSLAPDLRGSWAAERGYVLFETKLHELGAQFQVAMPNYMPSLIRHLDACCDIIWHTSWTHSANGELAAYLGVGPFPALTPEGPEWNWKAASAERVGWEAAEMGRSVYWIEDFMGSRPRLAADVNLVDTHPHMVLSPELLPAELKP